MFTIISQVERYIFSWGWNYHFRGQLEYCDTYIRSMHTALTTSHNTLTLLPPTPPFPTVAPTLPMQCACCPLLLHPRRCERLMGWPARCCPLAPRVGEVLSCSQGGVPLESTFLTCPAGLLCCDAGHAALSHHRPTEADAVLSQHAAWHMSPKLQGFCNINHQSQFLPGLRKPQFSSPPAALFFQRHPMHTQGCVSALGYNTVCRVSK